MILVDARRLTGPNHLSRRPLVVVELTLESGESLGAARDAYLRELRRIRTAFDMVPDVPLIVRPHAGGACLAYEAPLDVMLPCAEMSEWAALSAAEILAKRTPLELEPKRAEIEALLATEKSPRLLALAAEAKLRAIPLLWDDKEISIGAGARSTSWPRSELPDVTAVPWDTLGAIPIGLITGTNGKTTSTRLLAFIAREAGLRVGHTSSDEVVVGTEVLEQGDWTGPAAARIVLRRKDVDIAILETARGGILRRGLAMDACDAALITNVSDDHTGGYGIDDLAAMTEVKAVVAHAVRGSGRVVLNAHDPKLVGLARTLSVEVVFFANLDRDDAVARAVIAEHRALGKRAVFAQNGAIVVALGEQSTELVSVDAVPITFGGAAPYNIENAAGVVAMAAALGLPDDAMVRGLLGFGVSDNPRRGEILERSGVRVLLDFGHNPEGVRAVMQLVASLLERRPGRLTVTTGSPGDRSNEQIEEVGRMIAGARPHRVLVRELGHYLRGREPGEIPVLFRRTLAAAGQPDETVAIVDSEVEALRIAFDDAQPGDLVVILVHLDHDEVHAFLDARV